MTELKPISEKLTFKWNVVDCLEKLLVSTRLNTAEQEEIITELRKHESELLRDVKIMRELKPSSVSTWQEEFLDARLKEAKVNLEFEKIRRELSFLKQEILDVNIMNEHFFIFVMFYFKFKEQEMEGDGSGDFFSIKFNIRDKECEKFKNQKEISETDTLELQEESDRLKIQVRNLKF